jgi:hypothetical protein
MDLLSAALIVRCFCIPMAFREEASLSMSQPVCPSQAAGLAPIIYRWCAIASFCWEALWTASRRSLPFRPRSGMRLD